MTELNRVIKYKTSLKVKDIESTMTEWLRVTNIISKVAFDNNCISNNVRLHRLTYKDLRANSTLTSQLLCNAIREVASKYATARSNKQELAAPITFKQQAIALQRVYDFAYLKNGLSISTINGRIKGIQINCGEHANRYDDWERGGAVLQIIGNNVYLLQSIHTTAPELVGGEVAGLDKGINCLAVVTNGTKQMFFKGGKVKQVKNKYRKSRASLQKKKAEHKANGKRTHSVTRVLKRLSGRENRFMRDVNHCVSKKVVQFAVNNNVATIAGEKLEGIRDSAKGKGKRVRKMINGWSFFQLQSFISYKAAANGIKVEELDPAYSSQGCSSCGYTAKTNRVKHSFKCGECNYQLHSDLNASRNMRLRSIVTRQELCHDGVQVNNPLSCEDVYNDAN